MGWPFRTLLASSCYLLPYRLVFTMVVQLVASERGVVRRPPSSLTRLRRLNRMDSTLLGSREFNGRKVFFRTLSSPYRGPSRAATPEQRFSAVLDRNLDRTLRQNFAPEELPSNKVRYASELRHAMESAKADPAYRRHVVVAHDENGNILAFTRALVRTGQFEDGPVSVALRAFRWTHPDFRGGGLMKKLDSFVVPLLRQQAHVILGEIERFTPQEHVELERLKSLPHVGRYSDLGQRQRAASGREKTGFGVELKRLEKSLDVGQSADLARYKDLALRHLRIYAQHGLGARLALPHYFAPDGQTPWPGHLILYAPKEGQEVVRNGRVVVGPDRVDLDLLQKAVSLLHQQPIYAPDEGRALTRIRQESPELRRSGGMISLQPMSVLLPATEQAAFLKKEAAKVRTDG